MRSWSLGSYPVLEIEYSWYGLHSRYQTKYRYTLTLLSLRTGCLWHRLQISCYLWGPWMGLAMFEMRQRYWLWYFLHAQYYHFYDPFWSFYSLNANVRKGSKFELPERLNVLNSKDLFNPIISVSPRWQHGPDYGWYRLLPKNHHVPCDCTRSPLCVSDHLQVWPWWWQQRPDLLPRRYISEGLYLTIPGRWGREHRMKWNSAFATISLSEWPLWISNV